MTRPSGLIVGTGRAGTELHLAPFRAAGAEVVALVDIDESAARAAARKYGVPRHYCSVETALDAERPDFVSVCTPSSTHFAIAAAALEAGAHVLVEKPMTETLEEATRLRQIADAVQRSVCVVHNHRFYPGIEEAVRRVRAGAIGDVLFVDRRMVFLAPRVRMMEAGHWAHGIPGGRLFEANPHNIYLAYAFVGPMRLSSLEVRKSSIRWPHARIDGFTATLRAVGADVHIAMSLNGEEDATGGHGSNYMVVTGTKGTLLVDYHRAVLLGEAMAGPRDRLRSLIGEGWSRMKGTASTETSRSSRDAAGVGSGHKFVIDRFVAFLRGCRPNPPVSWEEAFETQRVNLEMGRAAEAAAPP